MKSTKYTAEKKEKKRQEKRKKREEEKVKSKSQASCVTFQPKNYLKNLLSALIPELHKLIVCIWIRTPRSVDPYM